MAGVEQQDVHSSQAASTNNCDGETRGPPSNMPPTGNEP